MAMKCLRARHALVGNPEAASNSPVQVQSCTQIEQLTLQINLTCIQSGGTKSLSPESSESYSSDSIASTVSLIHPRRERNGDEELGGFIRGHHASIALLPYMEGFNFHYQFSENGSVDKPSNLPLSVRVYPSLYNNYCIYGWLSDANHSP